MSLLAKLKRSRLGKSILPTASRLFNSLPKKDNLYMFESFHGKQYSDNPRALYEYIVETEKDAQCYWCVKNGHEAIFEKHGIPYVIRFSFKWFYLMGRAKYWINNARQPLWFHKSKQTVFLQTWHGTPLKKLGLDIEDVRMPGTTTENYRKNFIKGSSQWDALVSPNSYSSEIFRRAFHYDGNVIETGYPRNDVLTNRNNEVSIRSIKERLHIPTDKKVILYAPTWRDDEYIRAGAYKFQLQLDLERLKNQFGDDIVVILRMHYLIAEAMDISGYEGFAFNCSHDIDIADLYLISDMLITDYSSVFFDYAILKRPIIFFAYDIEKYANQLRGFYLDYYKDLPGPIVETMDELAEAIHETMNRIKNGENCTYEEFYNRFCSLEDGNASKKVVELIKNMK